MAGDNFLHEVVPINTRPFWNPKAVNSRVITSSTSKMSKFLSQRLKNRNFYGNRFTNNQRVNVEELEVVESTSSGSVDGLTLDGKEAKESSASYRRLQSTAQEEKPKPKLDESPTKGTSLTITGFRFCDMEVLSSVFSQL